MWWLDPGAHSPRCSPRDPRGAQALPGLQGELHRPQLGWGAINIMVQWGFAELINLFHVSTQATQTPSVPAAAAPATWGWALQPGAAAGAGLRPGGLRGAGWCPPPLRTLLPTPKSPGAQTGAQGTGMGWTEDAQLSIHCMSSAPRQVLPPAFPGPPPRPSPLTWQPQPQQDAVIHDGEDADHAG